jgi:hypothetical protein
MCTHHTCHWLQHLACSNQVQWHPICKDATATCDHADFNTAVSCNSAPFDPTVVASKVAVSPDVCLTCGLNQRIQLSAALPYMLTELLTKYVRRVPQRAFHLRCEQFGHFADSTASVSSLASRSAGDAWTGDSSAGGQQMGHLLAAMGAVLTTVAHMVAELVAQYPASAALVVRSTSCLWPCAGHND